MNERIRYTPSGRSPSGRGNPFGSLRDRAAGPIGRALAVIAGGVVLVAALFVSAVVFSVLLVVGAVVGGWFWWKTRGLRRELRERLAQMQAGQAARPGDPAGAGPAQARPDVIDGDFIREAEPPAR